MDGLHPVLDPTALIGDADDFARAQTVRIVRRLGCAPVAVANGTDVLAEARKRTPRLVILDVALPGVSSYELCRVLREEHGDTVPIALTSEHRTDPQDEIAALLLGADLYATKPLRDDLFAARLRRLLVWSAPSDTAQAAGSTPLTPRETDVLTLMAQGLQRREIATRLCITPKTTATHIEHILSKLGAHSQAQAVAYAIRRHVVALPGS